MVQLRRSLRPWVAHSRTALVSSQCPDYCKQAKRDCDEAGATAKAAADAASGDESGSVWSRAYNTSLAASGAMSGACFVCKDCRQRYPDSCDGCATQWMSESEPWYKRQPKKPPEWKRPGPLPPELIYSLWLACLLNCMLNSANLPLCVTLCSASALFRLLPEDWWERLLDYLSELLDQLLDWLEEETERAGQNLGEALRIFGTRDFWVPFGR